LIKKAESFNCNIAFIRPFFLLYLLI